MPWVPNFQYQENESLVTRAHSLISILLNWPISSKHSHFCTFKGHVKTIKLRKINFFVIVSAAESIPVFTICNKYICIGTNSRICLSPRKNNISTYKSMEMKLEKISSTWYFACVNKSIKSNGIPWTDILMIRFLKKTDQLDKIVGALFSIFNSKYWIKVFLKARQI